jgi:hypothetical protein
MLHKIGYVFIWNIGAHRGGAKGGRTHTPQSSGSRQIIESQSANCFLCRQNMNWIGREKSKMVEWNRLKSNNYS